jgi:hypothetical protein
MEGMFMFSKQKKKDEKEMHFLIVLDGNGDTQTEFDPADPVAVQAVRDEFNAIVAAQRPLTYKSDKDGEFEATRDFDPTAKETWVTPQNQGG